MKTNLLVAVRSSRRPDYVGRHASPTLVRKVVAAFVMIAYLGTFSLPVALAEELQAPTQAPVSRQEVPGPHLAAPETLTPEQLNLFADMVGESESTVTTRLQADPKLAQMALAATGAYTKRKSSGKTKTILGFTILGVGDLAGAVIIVTTPGYPNVKKGDEGQIYVGMAVSIVTFGIGLALGIPGIISLAKRSDEEWRSMQYYQEAAPPTKSLNQSRSGSGNMITWPLLTYNF